VGPGFGASVSTSPPLHFARPPTPGASSWPGATLAIQGGIEGERRPHPSSGRKARREGEEKAPAALRWAPGLWVAALRCARWHSARSGEGASILCVACHGVEAGPLLVVMDACGQRIVLVDRGLECRRYLSVSGRGLDLGDMVGYILEIPCCNLYYTELYSDQRAYSRGTRAYKVVCGSRWRYMVGYIYILHSAGGRGSESRGVGGGGKAH